MKALKEKKKAEKQAEKAAKAAAKPTTPHERHPPEQAGGPTPTTAKAKQLQNVADAEAKRISKCESANAKAAAKKKACGGNDTKPPCITDEKSRSQCKVFTGIKGAGKYYCI